MLFNLNIESKTIRTVKRIRLWDFGWDERKFQSLLFENLERMIREEELLVIMESRHWQEEPDLMAVDANGDLYIFELKAWESQSSNILQALKYGQMYGKYDYDQLNDIYKKFNGKSELIKEFKRYFPESEIDQDGFNHKQHFIILTNGVDIKTREAVNYWKTQGLDVRSWIYRLYKTGEGHILLELNTFSTKDDPFEDVEEGYFVVNTDVQHYSQEAEKDMLKNKKAAAYYDPWKFKINRIQRNDRVFLYSSGRVS